MYAPHQENYHCSDGDQQKRMANRFYPDYQYTPNKAKNRSFHDDHHNRPNSLPVYDSSFQEPNHARRGEQALPGWKYNNMQVKASSQNYCSGKECDSEYIMRTTLVRLLASSKRSNYTRQCLKQRFSTEKRNILKEKKRYARNYNEAILNVGTTHPTRTDQRRNRHSTFSVPSCLKNQDYDRSTNEEQLHRRMELIDSNQQEYRREQQCKYN